ncbi:MAG: ferritin-like domain-containing protein [Alphaproteobacteria bacterium]|nr:MAG: ferritin-like domain-containing protein [Alphaproteobacteria bacterium]
MGNRPARESMTDSRLHEFFLEELKDIYGAEKQIVKALPKMQDAATSPELVQAFEEHLDVTQTQITRLEEIFENLGESADAKKCEAMKGILDEGEKVIDDTEEGTATRDVALILAAQKVEHYEIATYGSLLQLAHTMGHTEVADLLEATLDEEKEADLKLTEIAESKINYQASEEVNE